MIKTIEVSALASVVGGAGENTTTVSNGRRTTSATRPNYAFCVDNVRETCRATHPGLLWGTNEQGAAQCQLENQVRQCGQPSAP